MKQFEEFASAKRVRTIAGVGYLQQAADILRTKWANPTLGASDYYAYRLYDRTFVPPERRRDFLGWRAVESLAEALNPRQVVLPAWDKLTLAILASAAGLPLPVLHALYRPGWRLGRAPASSVLVDEAELRGFLSRWTQWPLFAKPSYGQQGFGSLLLSGYDATAGELQTSDGAMTLDLFLRMVIEPDRDGYYRPAMGYLFQEVLKSHPAIASRIDSHAVAGLRVVCLRLDQGPEIIASLWKIPTGANVIDNFRRGASGNLVASVDSRSGSVTQVVTGFWPKTTAITHHPTTGQALVGFELPIWQKTVELVKTASSLCPLMRIQHWDVAITEKGPVLLELNDKGAIEWLQLAGKGHLASPLRALLKKQGNRRYARWIDRI